MVNLNHPSSHTAVYLKQTPAVNKTISTEKLRLDFVIEVVLVFTETLFLVLHTQTDVRSHQRDSNPHRLAHV